MAEPTLPQIFGTGTTRLANGDPAPSSGLFIPDSALVAAGLADPATAPAEGHLVALMLNAKSHLTQQNFDSNPNQSVVIEQGFSAITFRNNSNVRQDSLTLNLYKPDSGSAIDPDDY